MAAADRPISFTRPQQGPLTLAVYRQILERVAEGVVLTLTVSTGDDERICFFTRGAILFLAVGRTGGEILARKILAKKHLDKGRLDALVARANAASPLLQDILSEEKILEPKLVASLVAETVEDSLLELALWDGAHALYDLVPGNPPTRLYEPDVPALRISIGAKPLLERVLGRRDEVLKTLATLGGSLRNQVKLDPGTDVGQELAQDLATGPRSIAELVADAQLDGVPPLDTAIKLAQLIGAKKLQLERTPERPKEEELGQALRIEDIFDKFVNKLLARTHLAAIYERANENGKAAEQFRGIAEEHLKRGAVEAGIGALRNAVRVLPSDIISRELLVKTLRGASRLSDASAEAVALGRVLLEQNLPRRASQALALALKLVPRTLSVLWMLAGLLARLGEPELAIERYEEIAQISREANDKSGEMAAYQQILALDQGHEEARRVVLSLSGHARHARRQVASLSAVVVAALLLVAYAVYELAALRSFREARDQARAAVDEQRFDLGRSAVNEFLRGWTFSRFRTAADELLRAIDEEERIVNAERSLGAERRARELEAHGQLPRAADEWRSALQSAEDGPRRSALLQSLAACEAGIKKVSDDVATAQDSERQNRPEEAYELIASDLPRAPWLVESKDVYVPLLVDSIPSAAQITLDGVLLDKPTPLVIHRLLAPTKVRLEGRNREPVEREVEGLQSWPLVLVLPKKPAWRAASVVASSAPFLHDDLVIVAGLDRNVTAVARDGGAIRWRTSLGIFGESAAPPVGLERGIVAVRTCAGVLHGLSSDSGAARWSVELEPPPFDPLAAHPEQPVAISGGAIVREGARGLSLIGADGVRAWHVTASADVIGAPASQGELALVGAERHLVAFDSKKGQLAWELELPANPVLGPVIGPKEGIFVALERGALARVDATGKLLGVTQGIFGDVPITALSGDARQVFVGSQEGDVVALDGDQAVSFRVATAEQRPVAWIRTTTYAVLYGDPGTLYVVSREGKEFWRQPVESGAPASADDRTVFQGAADGLSAYDR